MAFTDVTKIGEALSTLNSARKVVRPDFCPVGVVRNRFVVGKSGHVANSMFWFGIIETRRAADCINAVLKANPGVRVVEDERGNWTAVCKT